MQTRVFKKMGNKLFVSMERLRPEQPASTFSLFKNWLDGGTGSSHKTKPCSLREPC